MRRLGWFALLALTSCPNWDESGYHFKCSPQFPQDCLDGGAPVDAGTTSDAGPGDAGAVDAGASDAGTADSGNTDAGSNDAGSDSGLVDAGPPCVAFPQAVIQNGGINPSIAINPPLAIVAYTLSSNALEYQVGSSSLDAGSFHPDRPGLNATEVVVIALPGSAGPAFALGYVAAVTGGVELRWIDASGALVTTTVPGTQGAAASQLTIATDGVGVGAAWVQNGKIQYAYDLIGQSGAWTLPYGPVEATSTANPQLCSQDSTGDFGLAFEDTAAGTATLHHLVPDAGLDVGSLYVDPNSTLPAVGVGSNGFRFAYVTSGVVYAGLAPLPGNDVFVVSRPVVAGRPSAGFAYAYLNDAGVNVSVSDTGTVKYTGVFPAANSASSVVSLAWANDALLGWAVDAHDGGVALGSACIPP